jgi:hypothetical protein
LKKLPAFPITAGSGNFRRRMRHTASATCDGARGIDAHRFNSSPTPE